jgi:NAD(P)H-nitrite reductase large subunit
LNDGVKAFSSDGSEVYLNTGHTIASDLNIMAVGIQPSTALAEDADLTIGETGGIKVNDYMQTSDEDIYALGMRQRLRTG